jgi:hypothetical protein
LRVCDTSEKRFRIKGNSRELGFVRLNHEWLGPVAAVANPDGTESDE